MRPGMTDGVKRWAGRIDTRISSASAPASTAPAATTPVPVQGDGSTLNVLLRGQSNAYFFADYGGIWTMRDRIQTLTGRKVNIIAAWGQAGDNTIYSGTEFLAEWMSGNNAGNYESSILRYVGNTPAASKTAPFVELWLHNESDQKVSDQYTTGTWVAAVRAEASLMRDKLGLQPSQHLRYFVPIRYNSGDITKIRAGMDQLAADSTFNARVSMAAWSLKMDNEYNDPPYSPNGPHMSRQDASDLAENLAQELSALYPAGGVVNTTGPSTASTSTATGSSAPPASTNRAIVWNPIEPNGAHPTWNTSLTCTGITKVGVVVQNDGNASPPWSFVESSRQEITVPGNGIVPVAIPFTLSGQFVKAYDANDPTFTSFSNSSFF